MRVNMVCVRVRVHACVRIEREKEKFFHSSIKFPMQEMQAKCRFPLKDQSAAACAIAVNFSLGIEK